jgi:hypothetical protein
LFPIEANRAGKVARVDAGFDDAIDGRDGHDCFTIRFEKDNSLRSLSFPPGDRNAANWLSGRLALRNQGKALASAVSYLAREIQYCQRCVESVIVTATGGDSMAKNKLKEAAETIGSAVGKADRTAQKAVIKATKAAKQELNQMSKRLDGLKKKLQKSTKQLKKALK